MSVQRMNRRDALKLAVASMLMSGPLVSATLVSRSSAASPEASPPAGSEASPISIDAYRLGAGDKIRVTVFGHEDLSGEFEVDGSGNVSLPLIRNIKAEGQTVGQLEQAIAGRLSPDYLRDPSINVEVLNYRPFFIYGEVNQPGSYPYVNGMKVVNAVAIAGGFTYRARTSKVRIIRGADPSRKPQDADRDTAVLPGDVIEVPERYF